MISFRKLKIYIKYGWKYLKSRAFRKKENRLSRGEAMIKSWLTYSDVIFKCQYHIKVPYYIRKSKNCYIDFMIWKDDKQYAIEYNGAQHYLYTPYFHKSINDFKAQQKRDKYIKKWCKDNNIIFVEIPYNWKDDQIIAKLKEITE